MSSPDRNRILAALHAGAAQGQISPTALERALGLAGILPTPKDWRRLVDRLLLLGGCLFLVLGVLFFFAFNWAQMGRLTKLAVGQGALLIALGYAFSRGLETLSGKAALFCASLLTGVVLAIFGQVYQTGADPYQLFLSWAVLISPWVIMGRFAPLYLLWLALIHVGLGLYWQRWSWLDERIDILYLLLAGLDFVALALWEWGGQHGIRWLTARWVPRLLAAAALFNLTGLAFTHIFSHGSNESLSPLFALPIYLGSLSACYVVYRLRLRDLLVLTLCALSFTLSTVALCVRVLSDYAHGNALSWLLIGLLIIAQSAFWAAWLRKIQKDWENTAC